MYCGRVLEKKPLEMHKFNPMAVVDTARAHLESISEPRRRLILENFIEHAEAEALGDFDRLMASCSRHRQESQRMDLTSLPLNPMPSWSNTTSA